MYRMNRATAVCALSCVVLASPSIVRAQVVNPSTVQAKPPVPAQTPAVPDPHQRSFEAPPIEVLGKAPIREEDLIGDYKQPRWTAARRFGETRIYVVPKGTAEFEYWLIPKRGRDGKTETTSQYEVEFGLPHRIQIDLYAVGHQTGNDGTFGIDGQKVEIRYALADWGKLFGNPTIYLEWKDISDAPAHFEAKLLLGGQLAPRWHWGTNFVWEHELGGSKENSNEFTTGLSYAAADTKVSLGVETQLALVNSETRPGTRGPFSKEFLIGPSIQLRPLPQVHLDIAPLFGTTKNSPRVKLFVVFGWEF